MRRPILNLLSSENHATVSVISIKPEDSDIMYLHLAILHQIFNKAEKYGCSSIDIIKSSPADENTTRSLIFASSSNPNSLHVVKFN